MVCFCEGNREQLLAALPWPAAEIGGNDGFIPMLEFVRRWSGARFYVPREHARFVAKAGVPIGLRTHRRFLKDAGAASLIEIPSAWGIFLTLRSQAIAAAIDGGAPSGEVARRFGVTERSLRQSAARS